MKNEEREYAVTSRLVYGEQLCSIAKKIGVSEATLCRTIKTFELVKTRDFETLIKKARAGNARKIDVTWAAKKLGVELPKELLDAFEERSRDMNRMRERVTPKADPQPAVEENTAAVEENAAEDLNAIQLEIGYLRNMVMTELKIQTSNLRNINLLLTTMLGRRGEEK